MIETIQNILEQGEKSGFSTIEAFGEKIEKQEYEYFADHNVRSHSAVTHRVTTRAFWEMGDPVGFSLSKPGLNEIKTAFSTIYSINLPIQAKNYAHLLPAAVERVDVKIYDDTIKSIDARSFDELLDQINEILISPSFKELELRKIFFSKALKRVYIANTNNLNAKYIKTHFNLLLTVGLGDNLIDISDSRTFSRHIEPFKLIARAYNLLNSLTERKLSPGKKNVYLVLSPDASAFILKEFSDYFKVKADKKFMDIPFPSILNIIDDPLMDGKASSVPFDDEGTQSREKYLIRKGMCSHLISDIQSAFLNGNRSTGNGFRNDRILFPSVRFSNLYIKPTVLSLKNLMEDAGEGILVSLLKLKYIEKEGSVFSAYGYRFSGNNLLEPVHFYFRTTFLSYFLNILKVSKEIKFFYSTFNIGSPYLLLEARQKEPDLLSV